jgi:hypothetical protein
MIRTPYHPPFHARFPWWTGNLQSLATAVCATNGPLDICMLVHNFAAIRWDRDCRCSTFVPRFCPANALQ